MFAALWFSLTFGASGMQCTMTPDDGVRIADRAVRIGDVVSLDCVESDARKRISGLTIAVLPPGGAKVELERAAIKSLVNRRVPGLALLAEPTDAQTFVISRELRPPQLPVTGCHRAARTIEAGEIVVAEYLRNAPCDDRASHGLLAFDRNYRVARASRDIAAGEFIGRYAAPASAYDALQPVTVTVAIGPVRIERQAELVRPAVAGEQAFVRDSNGSVFAVPLQADLEGED
jgi:hypothetical protein